MPTRGESKFDNIEFVFTVLLQAFYELVTADRADERLHQDFFSDLGTYILTAGKDGIRDAEMTKIYDGDEEPKVEFGDLYRFTDSKVLFFPSKWMYKERLELKPNTLLAFHVIDIIGGIIKLLEEYSKEADAGDQTKKKELIRMKSYIHMMLTNTRVEGAENIIDYIANARPEDPTVKSIVHGININAVTRRILLSGQHNGWIEEVEDSAGTFAYEANAYNLLVSENLTE